MNKVIAQKNEKNGINLGWLCQLVASISWLISVLVYGSYEAGDCLQLLAASAWTVSNIINYFTDNHMSIEKDKENK